MSYIPVSSNKMENDIRKNYEYVLPLEGVKFSMSEADFEEGKCRLMENLIINTNSISTVAGKSALFENFTLEKQLYSITSEGFCGKIVLHAGNTLYFFDKNSAAPQIISDILPDAQSIFVEILSKLYIYCQRHVYSLDNNFVFKEEEPFAPVLYKNVNILTPNYSKNAQEKVAINLIAPRITVEFAVSDRPQCTLPFECDTERTVEVIVNGEKVDRGEFTVTGKNFRFNNFNDYMLDRTLAIKYYVKNDSDIGFEDVFSKCRMSTVYGGNNLSGTRIFVTGNPDKKGVYYKSELLDPLYFPNNSYEIVGDGCDDITGMIKMYDTLVFFTEKAVYRMTYSYPADSTEPVFTIQLVSTETGCDVPGSIQLVDNRVVFANSKKGIYILDSQDEAGEQNIKPMSGNIAKNGSDGFFDCDVDEMKKACSIDFDRKYFLCVKDKAFVWDYDKSPYSSSSNYSKAQNRLIFTLVYFDDTAVLFNFSGILCSISRQNPAFWRHDAEKSRVQWRMLTGKMDMGFVYNKKQITDMDVVLKREKDSEIQLRLYSQQGEYYKTSLECKELTSQNLKIKLPAKTLSFFEFEISGTGGVEIYGIRIKYKIV